MIKKVAALLPLLALGAAPMAVDPVASLAGRYSERFPNAFVDGEKYTSENIVEIVPISTDATYVRVHTEWFNGHSCALWGIAAAEGDRLIYRDPDQHSPPNYGQCVLSVRHVDDRLQLNDEDNSGRYVRYCGMRGSFENVSLPFSSRRPITYLTRLRASPQFKEAMTNWRAMHETGN